MKSVVLACLILLPALAFLGGCDNKKVIMPSKTVEAPKDVPTGPPPLEEEGKKDATKPG